MLRTLSLVALLAAAVVPAHADELKVNTLGKDLATVKAEVTAAAQRACRRVYTGSVLAFYAQPGCVAETVATAMSKIQPAAVAVPAALAVTKISTVR